VGLNDPNWWYRILQIDRKRLVQCNLESAWSLAVAGCGKSDGLSEQSMEIVAVGLFGGEVMLIKAIIFLGVPALSVAVQPFQVILGEEWIALGLDPRSTFPSSTSPGIDPFSEMSIQDQRAANGSKDP
jgi:hypothetical protein